jgi:hypothetical protein
LTASGSSDGGSYERFGLAIDFSGTNVIVGAVTVYGHGVAYIYEFIPEVPAELNLEGGVWTVDGETYQPGDALPPYFDTSGFDWETGHGSISLHFEPGTAGDYSIQASFDYLFSGVLDKYAFSTDAVGTLADGQVLDMTQTGADVTATLGWDFSLAQATDWAELTFVIGETLPDDPYSVFTYTGSDNGTLAISSSIDIHTSTSTVPEPSTLLLLGSGLLGAIALRRKYRR